MYYLDSLRDKDGGEIYRTKAGFKYPLSKDRNGRYKVQSGEMLRVCMTSDFFLEEADPWRDEAWEIIHMRPDVKFYLLTKRPERVAEHLPCDWGDGWENVIFNVTCENQRRADERIPILLDLPFKHKGIMCAPFIGPVSVDKYLTAGQIEQVYCDGENYSGARPCRYEWVKQLHDECARYNVTFVFCGTGNCFIKDGKTYRLEGGLQREQAYKSGLSFLGKPIEWKLTDEWGYYDEDNGRYFAEIMYTSREGREQYDYEITEDIYSRLGTFADDIENVRLIKTGKMTYSFENTMYGTLGPERTVWDEEANDAMKAAEAKQNKDGKKKK